MILGLSSMWKMLQLVSEVVVMVENHEFRVCLTWMYIQHRHRLFFRNAHMPCPIFVSNYIRQCSINPLTWCGFLCGTQNYNGVNQFYYKTSSHICAQHQHPSEHDTHFISTFFHSPVLVISLINYAVFLRCIGQVFLKLFG